jgi:hypothetical protein
VDHDTPVVLLVQPRYNENDGKCQDARLPHKTLSGGQVPLSQNPAHSGIPKSGKSPDTTKKLRVLSGLASRQMKAELQELWKYRNHLYYSLFHFQEVLP